MSCNGCMLIWRHDDLNPVDLPEAFIDFLRKEGIVKKLGEAEIRNWRDIERERLSQLVDPTEKRCCEVVIATLDGVLND